MLAGVSWKKRTAHHERHGRFHARRHPRDGGQRHNGAVRPEAVISSTSIIVGCSSSAAIKCCVDSVGRLKYSKDKCTAPSITDSFVIYKLFSYGAKKCAMRRETQLNAAREKLNTLTIVCPRLLVLAVITGYIARHLVLAASSAHLFISTDCQCRNIT